ncbi:cobalamin biosynthesis protein [Methylobacterium sp. 77]|uniref:cobalamin biosynthesis protein n=1 Tax=Methylobacterium sp. 77 TaxID=1101192 RepID=UPI00036CB663|nr:cobalamin biosynthesis protein [Methylobacterium sp. 77]
MPGHRQNPDRRSLVAGIGFRHGAAADDIVALILRALAESGHAREDLTVIATAADRAGEPAIRDAAAAFGLVPTAIPATAMIAVDSRVPTRSQRIEASRQVGSVAEAAALAAAGEKGTLVLPRISCPTATCALALSTHFATQTP